MVVVSILLGISPTSEVYKQTFRNSVSVPSSWASRNNTRLWLGGKYTGTEIRERANDEVGLIGEERVVRAGNINQSYLLIDSPPYLRSGIFPTHPQPSIIPACPGRWNRHRVPKCRHIYFGRRGNSQKNTYYIQNTAKA